MILLISHDHIEEPTNNIIDWLFFFKANYRRINGKDFHISSSINIEIGSKTIKTKHFDLDLKDVNIVWYRRWMPIHLKNGALDFYLKQVKNIDKIHYLSSYIEFLGTEKATLDRYFFNLLNEKKSIPNIRVSRSDVNKLNILEKCIKYQIDIPDTIITSSKDQVIDFFNKKNKKIITKPISEVHNLIYKKNSYDMLTKYLSHDDIQEMPDYFFPTLYQEAIEKSFELRIFFIEDSFFSMAMFTKNKKETAEDFRNYDFENPNRSVPFNLPKALENKLKLLMKDIDLNTGSIDMIYDGNIDKYYFLEVNQVGQFGMVSEPCNYSIEKQIAQKLIRYDKKK